MISRIINGAGLMRGLLIMVLALAGFAASGYAASSRGCELGGFQISQSGNIMAVRGRHVWFDVDMTTGGVRNWTLTGAPNELRLVTSPTVIFNEKTPLHGAVLTTTDRLRNDRGVLELIRTNGSVTVKLQAKDCAAGGVFQMEIERSNNAVTRFRHVLGDVDFYYDNPNFRAHEGDIVRFSNRAGATMDITITSRVNFGSDTSQALVGRDSPQAATRINQNGCTNQIPKRDGTFATVRHCGGVTEWDVQSGGRMGQVMGEDSTEVAPPATFCTDDCQAQNQVGGGAVILGFPAVVPAQYRLNPRRETTSRLNGVTSGD